MPRIGVLALQGGFAEHIQAVAEAGGDPVEVRLPHHLDALDGIILPGGESTAIGKLLLEHGVLEPLRRRIQDGLPAYGTCAGMILMATEVFGGEPPLLRVLDVSVERNAFGRQLQSFETAIDVADVGPVPFPAVFIRAPVIRRVGEGVRVLARLPDGRVVGVRQQHLLATAFHPELTPDRRIHRYFIEEIVGAGRPLASAPND